MLVTRCSDCYRVSFTGLSLQSFIHSFLRSVTLLHLGQEENVPWNDWEMDISETDFGLKESNAGVSFWGMPQLKPYFTQFNKQLQVNFLNYPNTTTAVKTIQLVQVNKRKISPHRLWSYHSSPTIDWPFTCASCRSYPSFANQCRNAGKKQTEYHSNAEPKEHAGLPCCQLDPGHILVHTASIVKRRRPGMGNGVRTS